MPRVPEPPHAGRTDQICRNRSRKRPSRQNQSRKNQSRKNQSRQSPSRQNRYRRRSVVPAGAFPS